MMTDNDIIAEYVKKNNPGLIRDIKFVSFRLNKIGEEDMRLIKEAFENLKADDLKIMPSEEVSSEPYYEYIRQKGIEYCKKHCGTQDNLCGRCPLAFNLCCINQDGVMILNEDTVSFERAVAQYNFMIREVTQVDKD